MSRSSLASPRGFWNLMPRQSRDFVMASSYFSCPLSGHLSVFLPLAWSVNPAFNDSFTVSFFFFFFFFLLNTFVWMFGCTIQACLDSSVSSGDFIVIVCTMSSWPSHLKIYSFLKIYVWIWDFHFNLSQGFINFNWYNNKKITHKPVTSSKRTDEYPHGPHLKSNGCATHATQPF